MCALLRAIKTFLIHVALPVCYLGSDLYLLYELAEKEDWIYEWIMIANYLLPGLLEFIYWFSSYVCFGNCTFMDWIWWTGFSTIFPISTLLYNMRHAYTHFKKDVDHDQLQAEAKALNSIWSLKSYLQTIIHFTVMLLNWRREENRERNLQICSILFHLLHLVIHETERHYYECGGKGPQKLFNYKLVLRLLMFNLLHYSARAVILSFIIMCSCGTSNHLFLIIPAGLAVIFFFINFIIAWNTIKTSEKSKHVFTSFSAIFLPGSCYSAKADFKSSEETENQFFQFSMRNTFYAFLPVLIASHAIILCLHYFKQFDFYCHLHPPFAPFREDCGFPDAGLFSAIFGEQFQEFLGKDNEFYCACVLSFCVGLGHVLLVWTESCFVEDRRPENLEPQHKSSCGVAP